MKRSLELSEFRTDPVQNDNRARWACIALGFWRRDKSEELMYRYWRDIHGVAVARMPGIYQYRQLHLDTARPALGSTIGGIDFEMPPEDQSNGIADLRFLDKQSVDMLQASQHMTVHMFNDEKYLIERNAIYWSTDGNAQTYVDRTGNPMPQGQVAYPTFAVFFRRRDGSQLDAFRAYMRTLAERWAGTDGVMRVRLTLLEAFDAADFMAQSEGANHYVASDHQYQAWTEVVLEDERVARKLLVSSGGIEHAPYVNAIHTRPAREIYTLVHDGRPTPVGLRGYPAIETITAAEAENQNDLSLLEAVYGPTVHGTNPPARFTDPAGPVVGGQHG